MVQTLHKFSHSSMMQKVKMKYEQSMKNIYIAQIASFCYKNTRYNFYYLKLSFQLWCPSSSWFLSIIPELRMFLLVVIFQ